MVHRVLISIATVTVTSLTHSVPIHGREINLAARGAGKDIAGNVVDFFLQSWMWATIGIACVAFIALAYLLILSIKAFFMHRNQQPHHLFRGEPVNNTTGFGVYADARTGQLFCSLTVLSVFFSLVFFPMWVVFVILPMNLDNPPAALTATTFPDALTNMADCFGGALSTGALLALVSHRRCFHFEREVGTSLWKKVLDFSIVGLMIIVTGVQTVLYSIPFWSGIMGKVMDAMDHLYNAFYALAVLDLFLSVIFLRRRLKENRIHDQTVSNLFLSVLLIFIPFAVFNIIEDILLSHYMNNVNYTVNIFFIALINGAADFFGLYWVLRVYFPPKPVTH